MGSIQKTDGVYAETGHQAAAPVSDARARTLSVGSSSTRFSAVSFHYHSKNRIPTARRDIVAY